VTTEKCALSARILIALTAVVISSHSVAGAETGLPKALACSFSGGVFSTLEGREFKRTHTDGNLVFTIAAINERTSSAQIVGNAGASDMFLVLGRETASFIEPTPIGNINLTTIYLRAERNRYRAVHSRHVGTAIDPMVSQYLGWCEAKN
jgi:hypothetical protein